MPEAAQLSQGATKPFVIPGKPFAPEDEAALREALKRMGRADLIGNGKHQLIPNFQPATDGSYVSARRKNSTPVGAKTSSVTRGRVLTQHTGLPPRPGSKKKA